MIIKIKGETKEVKLTIAGAIKIEDEMGVNPLFIFATELPKIKDLKAIFTASGGTEQEFYDYFEDHSLNDMTKLCLDIFKESGLIKETDSKNV